MAYARYEGTAVDEAGNVLSNATVEVREDRAGRPVVPLFSDRQGTVPMGNPIQTDSQGRFAFHARGGVYWVRVYQGPSQEPTRQYIRRYQAIGTAAERDVEDLVSALSAGIATFSTLAGLTAFTPGSSGIAGLVLSDSAPANNGYYTWTGSAWVRRRGFPDTIASVTLEGAANAQTGSIASGVSPADVEVFYGFADTPNTGPMTLSISSYVAKPVLNIAGNELSASEWSGAVFFIETDDAFQLIVDAGAAEAAATSASGAQTALASIRSKIIGSFENSTAAEAHLTSLGLSRSVGSAYYDTTDSGWAFWNGSAWQAFPDGTSNAAQLTQVQVENPADTTFGLVSAQRIGQAFSALIGNLSPNRVLVETASGTWTKPAGLSAAYVLALAAGSGGGGVKGNNVDFGAASGGAAGGCAIGYYDANELGATEAITIGIGGAPGAATPGNGGAGGETRFTVENGSDLYADGGSGGLSDTSSATLSLRPGVSGGIGHNSNIGLDLQGGNGFPSTSLGTEASSGMGGSSILGGGGVARTAGSGIPTAGSPGRTPGSGGSGAVTRGADGSGGAAGGAGADGLVIIIEIYAAD